MIRVVDLKEIRFDSADLDDLRSLLKQLVGQPFQFLRESYGDELRLHLGSLRAFPGPRMAGKSRGSYVVGARASSWIIHSARLSQIVMTEDFRVVESPAAVPPARPDDRPIGEAGYIPAGTAVVQATADRRMDSFTLRLEFSDGSTVFILPDADSQHFDEGELKSEEPAGVEIADWEILTPHDRILKVGQGPRWSYLDSKMKRGRHDA